MAPAGLRWIDRQAGLTTGALELPAHPAAVVGLATEWQGAAAIGGEQQAAAVPLAVVGIEEADRVAGVLDDAAGPAQIKGPVTLAQKPVARTAPTPLEVAAVELPLASGFGHDDGWRLDHT